MITVIDHLAGHAAVYADVLAGNEACLVGTEEQHHVGYVFGIAHSPYGLLSGIGTVINGISSINPSR